VVSFDDPLYPVLLRKTLSECAEVSILVSDSSELGTRKVTMEPLASSHVVPTQQAGS